MRKPDDCYYLNIYKCKKIFNGNIICTSQRLKPIISLEIGMFNYFKILGINQMQIFKCFSLS